MEILPRLIAILILCFAHSFVHENSNRCPNLLRHRHFWIQCIPSRLADVSEIQYHLVVVRVGRYCIDTFGRGSRDFATRIFAGIRCTRSSQEPGHANGNARARFPSIAFLVSKSAWRRLYISPFETMRYKTIWIDAMCSHWLLDTIQTKNDTSIYAKRSVESTFIHLHTFHPYIDLSDLKWRKKQNKMHIWPKVSY